MRRCFGFIYGAGLLVLLGACADEISVQGADDFGVVKSAVWLETHIDSQTDGKDRTAHLLFASNQPNLCSKLQDASSVAATYSDRWFSQYQEGSAESQCDFMAEYAYAMDGALDGILDDGGKLLTLEFFEEGGWEPVQPQEGTFGTTGEQGGGFNATLLYSSGNYYDDYAANLSPTCSNLDPTPFCCRPWPDELPTVGLYQMASKGTYVVESKGSDRLQIGLDINTRSSDYETSVDLEGEITFEHCPVDLTVEYMFLNTVEPFQSTSF